MTPNAANKGWLIVAAAISKFWEGMDGPSTSATRSALGFAGVEYNDLKGSNRQDKVRNAVSSAKPDEAKRLISELVSLLVEERYFDEHLFGDERPASDGSRTPGLTDTRG